MAIKVNGTTVIDNSRVLSNITSIDATTASSIESNISTDPTLGSLTKTFISGETATITLSASAAPAPVVSVTKEVAQTGVSSKGTWDVLTNGANYDIENSAYNTTLTPVIEYWDVSKASYVRNFSVATQDTNPKGIFFKPDGTKMYVLGDAGRDVNEYSLSTAWNISTASYVQVFSVNSQETGPRGIFFKPDGTKMYIVGIDGDEVNEYNLSSAWDVSTASHVQLFSVSAQETLPTGVFFKPDGTKMYIVGQDGDDVNEYSLSSAWDISTASYVQVFSVAAQETFPNGIFFKPDGTKMYIVGGTGQDVNEYSLSSAWDISTASYVQVFSVSAQDTAPVSIFFKPDGAKMYIVGSIGQDVNEYDLAVASQTLTLGSGSFASSDVGKKITGNGGVVFLENHTTGAYFEVTPFNDTSTIAAGDWSMVALEFGASGVTLPFNAGNSWDISKGSYVQNFSIATEETLPQDIFFKPDGTKMYVLGSTGDDVNEYSLSSAWDISTASYVQNFSVSAQEIDPRGIFFKPDGTKMYITGTAGQDVNEYNLSTAWNVSTASYVQVFSVSAQETSPTGIFFKPDGTKMYVLGASGQDVNEYNLSTAWNVSTASYVQVFSVSAQETAPSGVFFKPDGTKMYIVGNVGDDVNEYNLSTAWNVSTASYVQVFSVSAQETAPSGVFFKPDGAKMYIVGTAGDDVNEYNVGSTFFPKDRYEPTVTNSFGRIDSTYWTDLNSMVADQTLNDGSAFYAVSTDGRTTWKVIHNTDGERSIVRNNAGTWQYNSNATYGSTTWTSATTNTELAALREALTQEAKNRMDKTQLDAVTDPNHYTLGNSLDLMIALYAADGSATMPVSDGVTINYDAAALNRGAVLGTDYNFDFPANDKVRITSLAAQNLKVRVV